MRQCKSNIVDEKKNGILNSMSSTTNEPPPGSKTLLIIRVLPR